MAAPARHRKKIAILGGGPSSLVAAFRLTEEPDWETKYDITLYQQGWRVGGKCGTGRDLDRSKRLYEHGIHGFLGCYYNALTVMKRVYDALDRPAAHPLADFEKAFFGMSGVIRYEMDEGRIKKWPIYAPPDWHGLDRNPDGSPRTPTLAEAVALAPKLARIDVWAAGLIRIGGAYLLQAFAKTYRSAETCEHILKTRRIPPAGGAHPMRSDPANGRFDTRIAEGEEALHAALGGFLARVAAAGGELKKTAAAFRDARDHLHAIVSAGGGGAEARRDRLRRLSLVLDFFGTILRGVHDDRLMTRGFDVIDRYDHVEWLRRHGAAEETIRSPLTASTPNITYQYPDGDSLRPPVMAAGAYLHWTMMSFTYMGEFIELFEAGSGETLIAPLHEVLAGRGVKFAFFHRVTDLRAASDAMEIGEIDVDVQATVKAGPFAYHPYVEVGRGRFKGRRRGLDCWPDRPLYDQLEEGAALKASGADLESFWCDWAPVGRKTLKRGEDFDEVILGISVGALPFITEDLARRHRPWRRMLKQARTVATQAMQLWLNRTPWELGWSGYTNEYDDYLLSANFMTQPNGQGDFSKYIKYEEWPEGHEPAALMLLCGTLPLHQKIDGGEGPDFPRRLAERVKHQSVQFLQATGGAMLPGATVLERRGYGDPFAFDFELLHAAAPETAKTRKAGAARFEDQYWRVNASPSDHYVSTPPGSTRHRLAAHDTGFANLSIAGDWTRNGLNVGSMEGSVRSGLLAAEAVLGVPPAETGVIGFDPTVKAKGGRRP